MKYNADEILQRLKVGEDSGWEFKEVVFSSKGVKAPMRDVWADEIAAFANASGGVMLCGVTDAGEPQGMSRDQIDALDNFLVEVSTASIKSPVRIEAHHRQLPGDKLVLVLVVPEGDGLHGSPGGNFVRVGGTKRKMSSDESLRLAQRRSQARYLWFDKQPVPDTGFNTLEESLWKPLLSVEGRASPERGLQKLALLVNDPSGAESVPRASVAGILLCTSAPNDWLPQACIMATCYQGIDQASGQIDSQKITGPLHKQVEEAMAFVTRNMRVAAEKVPARIDRPQYSKRAAFEALVNAVVHRDYTDHSRKVRLSMFNNRLEIRSPGRPPNNLDVDGMMEEGGQATRNEALTSVFSRLPVNGIHGSEERQYFMESRGDGLTIIRNETEKLTGHAPKYRLVDSDLCLTIPAAPLENSEAEPVTTVRCDGQAVANAEILVLFPNKTWKHATTDENGEATFSLHSSVLPMTVFAAKAGYAACLVRDWVPSESALALELEALPNGGSAIFSESTGHLPGLAGRLNPILDSLNRTYLYADNIAINEGQQQPVHFALGEDLHLVDADGKQLWVRFIGMVGRSALLEYRASQDG